MKSPLIFRIFKSGQLVGVKQFDLPQVVIGHNADVQLNLESDEVSPIHCLIESRDNGYFICDLGSSSGTFKNGQAILDEMISSGDEIQVGPFKLVFFVGVPKPKAIPGAVEVPPPPVSKPDTIVATSDQIAAATAPQVKSPAQQVPPPPEESPVAVAPMPPASVAKIEEIKVEPVAVQPPPPAPPAAPVAAPVKKQEEEVKVVPVIPTVAPSIPVQVPSMTAKSDEKPAIVSAPVRPEIRRPASPFKKAKMSKTFAPDSEIKDLRSYLKPGKGGTVEIIVAWRERILTTYHFKGSENVKVGSGKKNQIALPEGLIPRGYILIDKKNGVRVNATEETKVEVVANDNNVQAIEQLTRSGKAQKIPSGNSIRLDQSEMVCLTLPGGNLNLYIRYVADAPVVPILPMMLSGSELTGLVMSLVIVGVLALYISATTPKDWEENKQDDVQHVAQIIFNKPPPKPTPPPTPTPTPTPPPVAKETPKPTPTPPPKKVVVADMTKEEHKKGPSQNKPVAAQQAAKASEVAPKENKNLPKKFTSTRQGGAVKTSDTASANAQSANKDVTKVGLFSAFGGGGNRAKIDQAYSGSGEVLGMADKATGTSGQNENRAGDDLGSKFKDTGAGGKGTATQGIAGIGTKGRGNGQSNYGASEGFGSKSSVAIEGGGFGESFDGTIDKEAIRRVIRAKLHEVKSCYERALNTLEKGHKLEGKIVLGWEIAEKGQARNVKIKSSTLGNAQVENCIRDHLASWTFPEPPPGLIAEVQAYPFVLNQSN